jgi:cytochrome P450
MIPDRASERFPLGSAVTLDALNVDPYPILSELRAVEPVTWVPETGMWFVTRRDDALAILRDARRFTTDAERSTIRDIFGRHMMTTDGEVALRYKRSCLHAFRADTLAREMKPWVEARVARLLEQGFESDSCELIADVATPLAVDSALYVLGLPLDLADQITDWFDAFAAALANFSGDTVVRDRGKLASGAFGDAVRPYLASSSTEDRGLLAHLATREVDRLDDEEIIANALIMLFGGIETTASMIANTVWSLLASDCWSWLIDDRSRLPGVIEESLRWQPAVQSITRHTTDDLELRGVSIPAGSVVQSMIGGANRDPEHFDDPNRFDPERTNAGDHLSFGAGRHLCLGAHLARIEIEAVLAALMDRTQELVFAGGVVPAMRGYEFRRPVELRVSRESGPVLNPGEAALNERASHR